MSGVNFSILLRHPLSLVLFELSGIRLENFGTLQCPRHARGVVCGSSRNHEIVLRSFDHMGPPGPPPGERMAFATFEALAVVILANLAIVSIPSVSIRTAAAALLNLIRLNIALKFDFVIIVEIC